MNIKGTIKPKIEVEFWITPKEDDNIEQLLNKIKDKYSVLEIDRDNNRIKIGANNG